MSSQALGTALIAVLVFAACCAVALSRLPLRLKVLICLALSMRVVGALARYLVLTVGYNGVGDAVTYYRIGLTYAERFWALDFSPLYNPIWWRGGKWWGTQFIPFPSSIITTVIGPTMLGSFVAFSLLALIGLVGFAVAFKRWYPNAAVFCYARWIWLFPSLWFWPSSIGKEAMAIFALGITMLGLFGRGGKVSVIPLGIGFFLLSSTRPELAGIVAVSVLLSQWLGFQGRWTPGRIVQAIVLGLATIFVLRTAAERTGIESFDLDGVQTYIETEPGRASYGAGSRIQPPSVGLLGFLKAPVNMLLRPFPWEARGAFMLGASMEVLLFWWIVWVRREGLLVSLRLWRHDRQRRLCLIFVLAYGAAAGMMLSNLGIIARQRIFMFPFLFLLLEAPGTGRQAEPVAKPPRRAVHVSSVLA